MAENSVYKSIPASEATNRTVKSIDSTKKIKIVTTINKIFTLLKAAHS